MADAVAETKEEASPDVPRVLIADDEPEILRVFQMVLEPQGYDIVTARDGVEAAELFAQQPFDAVLTDLTMPGLDGVDLLKAIRKVDLDVPVVFVTAAPSLETAIRAVEYGALRYLVKPVRTQEIIDVTREAVRLSKIARLKREALSLLGEMDRGVGDQAGLEVSFDDALEKLHLHYQPIISWKEKRIFAFEALVRSKSETLPHPGALLDAAERLHRMRDLGRAVRHQAPVPFEGTGDDAPLLFVNLHSQDLKDPDLLSPVAPLAARADRVVLEITERASLDGISGVRETVAELREMGYRIAVDDLGAGYAGLTTFSSLEPDVVKLDMALVRGVDASPTKQKVIRSFVQLCGEMEIRIIAEGVETVGERDVLIDLGCDLFQGFLFARPGPPFPEPDYGV